MNHEQQIKELSQNRHLIAGGVYRGATVEQVAGWIQVTCELAMRVIPKTSGNIDIAQVGGLDTSITSATCRPIRLAELGHVVTAARLSPAMPNVEFYEDDGEIA